MKKAEFFSDWNLLLPFGKTGELLDKQKAYKSTSH